MDKEKGRKFLIATRSKGKFPEIIAGLQGLPFAFLSLNDIENLPLDFEVEESAASFERNAIIKAMIIGRKTGLLTLADDSGLEIDALGGWPGVRSARDVTGPDNERCLKIIEKMKDIPDEERGAQFRCVVAIYDPETDKIRTCEGIERGGIIRELKGGNGFGFDPIFYNEDLKKTNAEMTLEEKNSISHRGAAIRKAREVLKNEFL